MSAVSAPRRFPLEPAEQTEPLSICIVTFEAIGFWRNGGIATVSTGLAELLSAAGHRVTLALTRSDTLTPEDFETASVRYVEQGIEIVAISRSRVAPLEGPIADFTAWERYAVYDWLKTRRFDVVHSSEHLGEVFYCLAAKKLGVAFETTHFWVGCHGPSAWVIEANEELARDAFWIWTDAAERFVLREADLVWTPSRYLLGWMTARGFDLPLDRLYQQTYFIPDDLGAIRDRDRVEPDSTRELIFFGRLEPRKGLKLFIAAVLALRERLADVAITFMGRQSTIDGVPAGAYIACRLDRAGLSWRILDDLDREAAYTYVVGPGRVAVLASPVDNSPCAVYELLEIGARFVACAGGGIPELLDPSCHAFILFDYTVDSLVARLSGLIEAPSRPPIAAPSLARSATVAAWTNAHAIIPRLPSPPRPNRPKQSPTVTVAVVVDAAGPPLDDTLEAVAWLGNNVSDLVLIVSDRRAVIPSDAHAGIERLSLDAHSAVSALARLRRGERPLLVLRSGALVTPEGVARLLQAVTGADAIVPFSVRDGSAGGRITLPVLPGDWAWTALYGAAPVGGILSPGALTRLEGLLEEGGTNPLLWFDLAVLEGLSVVPLAEALLDETAVDRTLHAQADTRAREIACARRLTPGMRVVLEVAISSLLRNPAQPPAAALPAPPRSAETAAPSEPARLPEAARTPGVPPSPTRQGVGAGLRGALLRLVRPRPGG